MKTAQQILSEFVAEIKKHDKGTYTAPAAPHTYLELEAQADVMDFHEVHAELKKLSTLTNIDEIRNRFKVLVRDRFSKIEGTTLGFFSNSKRNCSQLLWQTAKILFEPASLNDMMQILFPAVTNALVVDVKPFVLEGRLTREKIKFRIVKTALAEKLAGMPADIEQLRYFVLSGDSIFDMRQMDSKDFRDQKAFFTADDFPVDLRNKIYRFNDSLAELARDLTMLVAQGKSMLDVMKDLEAVLILNNEKYKGGQFTSDAVTMMIKEFGDYIESLPAEYKAAVLAMKTSNGETLNVIYYTQIANSVCAIKALDDVRSLINNPVNHDILHAKPKMSVGLLTKLVEKYKKKTLSVQGEDNTKKLPSHLSRVLLKNYVINDAEDYLELLLKVPVEEMELFLTSCSIRSRPKLPVRLAVMLSSTIFTPEQVSAFIACVWKHRDNFEDSFGVLMFAAACKGKYFTELFSQLDEETRNFFAVQRIISASRDVEGFLLEQAILFDNHDAVDTIIESIPKAQRKGFFTAKDLLKVKLPFLYQSIAQRGRADMSLRLIRSLPTPHRAEVANTLLNLGEATFTVIERNPSLLSDLADLLPNSERSSIVAVNSPVILLLNKLLRSIAADAFDNFTTVFLALPNDLRFQAIINLAVESGNIDLVFGQSVMSLVSITVQDLQFKTLTYLETLAWESMIQAALRDNNLEAFTKILSFGNAMLLFEVLSSKHLETRRLLHVALSQSNALDVLLAMVGKLTSEQLKKVLSVKDNSGRNVFQAAVHLKKSDIASHLLYMLCENDRIDLLATLASHQSDALIFDTPKKLFPSLIKSRNHEGVRRYLEPISDKAERFAVLSGPVDDSNTALHVLLGADVPDTKTLLVITESLPSTMRMELLRIKNADGNTPIDLAVAKGHVAIVQELLPTIPARSRDNLLRSSFKIAMKNKSIEMLLLLLTVYSENEIVAAQNKKLSANRFLVEVLNDILALEDDRIKQFMTRANAVVALENETALLEIHINGLKASNVNDAKMKVLKKLGDCFGDLACKSEVKLDDFSDVLRRDAHILMQHSDSKTMRILKNIGHILASVLTLGAYAVTRAIYSHAKRGSALFWKSDEELYVKRCNKRLMQVDLMTIRSKL